MPARALLWLACMFGTPVRRSLVLGLTGAVVATAVAGYSIVETSRFARADARRTTFVYAAGQFLAPGVQIQRIGLAATLARLGYAETPAVPALPGQFRRGASAWELFLRGAPHGDVASRRVRVEVADDRITRLTRDGRDVDQVTLDPEVLASATEGPGESHRPIRLAETPRMLVDAVLAAEDHRFFEHRGLDARALVRAAWSNLRTGRIAQGGSTITQQLVKNRLLGPERTWWRKLREAWLATLVEWRYPKTQILEMYLNEIYLGQRGPLAIRGIGAAARVYFAKELHQLTLGEAALLAGMIRAPNSYSPGLDPVRARERRDAMLRRMRDLGMVDEDAVARARREPVRVQPPTAPGQPASHFVDAVRQELEQRFGADVTRHRGLRVFTTLDLTLQRFAEVAVARGLDRVETRVLRLRRQAAAQRLQAVLIAIDPQTGHLLALVGGRDYLASQFNRAALARRQPGSAFKPFVYLAALRQRDGGPTFTAATRVDDTPITLLIGGRPWTPRNYEGRYEQRVSVRRALEESLNAATVRIAETVGLPRVIETARDVGFDSRLDPVPALALGAFEVTPLELVRAYAPLASGGVRVPGPFGIRGVYDGDEALTPTGGEAPAQVISPAEAYLMTSLLEGVVASGTGAAARALGVSGPVAGKTGTTNDGRDAWFVGYTPRLLSLVWVGFDSGEGHGLSGAQAALPIWADFMRQANETYPRVDFVVPAGIVVAEIDATNGKRATRACPVIVSETFLAGTEPTPCDEHGGVIDHVTGLWNRLRDWLRR